VVVKFPCSGHVYEVRGCEYLGKGSQVTVHLGVYSAPLLAVMKRRAKGISLQFDGTTAKARLQVTGGGRAGVGDRVFRFDLFTAKGRRLLDAGANVVARGGAATWKPPGALPTDGRMVCRDVATGVSDAVELNEV
jgi:hypothetical protein